MEGSQHASSPNGSQEAATGQDNQQQQFPQEKTWAQKVKEKFLPGVRITLFLSLAFYIAMFGVGIWGIHRCPVEENIPFFLIVTGGIGLLSKLISLIKELLLKNYPVQYVESSFYTVELVFMILGSYWVFKEYKPSFNPFDHGFYCNKTVYWFAFTYLTVLYSIMFIILVCFCCFLGCLYFVNQTQQRNNQDPESSNVPFHRCVSESEQKS